MTEKRSDYSYSASLEDPIQSTPPIAPTSNTTQTRKATKPSPITTVEEFLNQAYQSKGKRIPLQKNDACTIATSDPVTLLSDKHKQQVRDDSLLNVPIKMLLTSLPYRSKGDVYERLLGLVRLVLLEHPASTAVFTEDALANVSTESITDTLLRAASFDPERLGLNLGKSKLTRAKLIQLRQNLVLIAGMWANASSNVSLSSILEEMCTCAWQQNAEECNQDEKIWRVLADTKDATSLGIVSRLLNAQVSAAQSETRNLSQERDACLIRIQTLEEQLHTTRLELDNQILAAREVANSLNAKLDKSLAGQSHLRDDFERLRTQVLRSLSREVDLLDDGLQALRRDPPRVKVMIDHAERAAEGMRKQIDVLRGESV